MNFRFTRTLQRLIPAIGVTGIIVGPCGLGVKCIEGSIKLFPIPDHTAA